MLKKLAFIHLMATCLLFLIDYACRTSEKVPSPFLEIKRYSINTKNVSVKIPSKYLINPIEQIAIIQFLSISIDISIS